jgi:uncharacterized oxidoreductase
MKTKGNKALITGGATGIGFALANAFVKAGNEVIICGRSEEKLKEAAAKLPGLDTIACDVSDNKDRESLFKYLQETHKDLNILINNAGVQRMIDFKKGAKQLNVGDNEIETNFAAPVRLSAVFIPWLLAQKEAAIFNVSSGLGFVPIASMPVYCATKAAIHIFTVSLRRQMKDTPVKVFEIIPPAVDTELDRNMPPSAREYRGIPPEDVAKATLDAMAKDQFEIIIGEAANLVSGSRTNFDLVFQNLNQWS